MIRTLAAALCLLLAAAARADACDEALAAARREAAAGRWRSAALLLEAPARSFPQDYPVQLERAWYLFQAGELGAAAGAYGSARALAPEAVEPELGLGWTALRDADPAGARAHFAEVLRRAPEQASAREGLALLGPEHRLTLGLGGAYAGAQAASRASLLSGTASLDALLLDRLSLGALYRALGAQQAFTGARGRGGGGSAPLQHELHGSAGWAGSGWSATVHGGWIGEVAAQVGGSRTVFAEEGWLAGASGWLHPLPWLELDASLLRSAYASGQVLQGQAAAGLRLGERLLLRAGARAQAAPEGRGLAGLASLELRGRWQGWLAAEVGTQRRPVDLAARAFYPVNAPLLWAGRAGLVFPLGGTLSGVASLDLESWGPSAPGGADAGLTWRGGGGLRLTF